MKYRSIQLGVIAIATLCIIILLMAMFYYYKVQQNQNNTLNEIGWEQRKQIIETVISIKKEQSESVLHENSAWTELIEYINDPTDEDWIYENIGTMSESYDNAVNVVVFNKKGTLVYENPVEGYEDIEFFRDIKIPTLFRNDYKINFVLYQGDKVFEYFGSTVVSSEDIVTRKEEASGYLFLIREINDTLLNEYNNALGCLETAVTHNGRQLEEKQKENKDNYFYSIELKNHFGNTIAYMYFVSGNPIQNILKSFLPMLLFMFGVVLAMFIALLIYTRARITKPLQQIAKIFEKEDYKKIEHLTDNPTEFGVLSKAIIAFFKQKHGMESLNKELESKQEELQQQNGVLQKQKDEIESQIENIKVLNQQIMERNKDTERKNVQISVKNQQLVEQSENIKGLQGRIEDLEYTIKFNQKQLEMANAHLLDNQNYASRLRNVLQVALTPTKHVFTDFFLHTKPKEKIGGDFWFAKKIENWVIAGIGDCNMQGISGAVLSGVDIYLLDEILNKLKSSEWNPSIVLNSLNEKIQSTMGEAFVTDIQRDGLHMSMFMYNTETLKGYYAGAKRTMVVTRRGEVTEYFGDNLSLGKDNGDKEYNCINIQLFPDDTIYMYSDGCTDVVGGPYCKPLLTVNFKKEIQRKQVFTLAEQKIQFKKFFEDWIGDLEQTDDITMLAFKI